MQIIKKLNGYLARLEGYILTLVVLTMVLLSFLQLILRGVFDIGILWGDIFLRHLVLWIGFIGASIAAKEEKHINIDVLSRFLGPKAEKIVHTITYLFAAAISWILADAAYMFVKDEMEFETIIFKDVPAWYFQVIIPIGFVLIALRFALIALEKTVGLFKEEEVQA